MVLLLAVEASADPTLLGYLYAAAALGIAGGLVAALLSLSRYLATKKSLGAVALVGARIAELAHAIANHVVEGLAPQLRLALADGRLDAAERHKLLVRALQLTREALTERGFGTLQSVLGVASDGAKAYLENAVSSALERKILAVTTADPTKPLAAPLAAAELVAAAEAARP